MPIRNPFGRRSGVSLTQDEHARASTNTTRLVVEPPGFERVDTVGSKASSLSIAKSRTRNDVGVYELSVVNDSGIYLPPSPVEEFAEKSSWSRRRHLTSRSSCASPASTGEIEQFPISRESFDSYRRSFDISAKAPISHEYPARQSLDSARFSRQPRAPLSDRFPRREPPTAEEEPFEDVGLGEPAPSPEHQQHENPGARRKGFFSMFSEGQAPGGAMPSVSRFLPGKRRNNQGAQGSSEMGSMEKPGLSRLGEEVG